MAEARVKPQPALEVNQTREAEGSIPPDEVARRELVAWCEAHGLPVPPDRRAAADPAQSSDR